MFSRTWFELPCWAALEQCLRGSVIGKWRHVWISRQSLGDNLAQSASPRLMRNPAVKHLVEGVWGWLLVSVHVYLCICLYIYLCIISQSLGHMCMTNLSEGSSTCIVGHLWIGFCTLKSTTENFPFLSFSEVWISDLQPNGNLDFWEDLVICCTMY